MAGLSWQLSHRRPLRATLAPSAGSGSSAAAIAAVSPGRGRAPSPLWTARQAAWLVVRRAAQRDAEATQPLAQLRAQHAEVAEAIDLAQDFAQLVRQQHPQELEPWLARAAKSAVGAFQRFAKGLRDDYDAINAGATRPWSHGPVERQITRLQLLKRQRTGCKRRAPFKRRFSIRSSNR